ncbi:MAG: enoyl-[acyl-carrier-protein] reductase FabK [Oscillospiraceae bacterium]|nr:enoyl-[acyl-carrier-protein] reductase FabK [Oscillospiraceae bacterium]
MKNRVTELLGIEKPIIQGGMAWIAESTLASAVSNAGGAGIIAGGSAPIDYLRSEIRKCKELTDKPFGVNIMLMSPNAEELAKLVIEEGVSFVTTGAGNPGQYIAAWKEAGIKVIPVVPSVALAKRLEKIGADAVIAEGTESGGHIGQNTTMCLVPQVVDAVSVPVIAAGGIADGRGIAASFMLGAEGVQIGTRFLASEECQIHENYKNAVIKAKDTDNAITGFYSGSPCRCIKSKYTKKLQEMEKMAAPPEDFEALTVGSLRKAVVDGNTDEGSMLCGLIAGMINEVKPVKDIMAELSEQAGKLLGTEF